MRNDDRDPERPGALAKYILGERMASGGMAEIFHAEPMAGRFDGPIVLKQMLPALAEVKDFVAMFIEEARISTGLDHPNIVKVHDFEATDRGLFLVMDLVDGPDLLAVMTRCAKLGRHIEPELAAYIACHVLEALDYAHGAASPKGVRLNVVHRDVSPSNILISKRGHVKLADFGIARATTFGRTKEIASGSLKGKFGYMSPEQVRGDDLDGRSDVFSMGIVLAEMLMTRRLFSAPNDVDLLLMVRRGDLSRLDTYGRHIPDDLTAILRIALEVDLDKRFASADAFRNALVDWLESSKRRAGAGKMAELLRELEREGGDLCEWTARRDAQKGSATMSGKETVIARKAATEAAALGRIAFSRAATAPPHVTLAPFHGPGHEPPASAPAARRRATTNPFELESGDLDPVTVVDLLCKVAREKRTGALMITCGELFKEAYFVAGNPVFVRCNVLEDRFGEFLVRRGIITRDELDRALASLDHFDGRLGQALVSLDLVQPVDAVRLLCAQVAGKLVTACSWGAGSYEFREGEQNPWPALALELRTFSILGRSLGSLPIDRVVVWAKRMRECPAVLDLDAIRAFELDPRVVAHLTALAGGGRTLGQLLDSVPTPAERYLVTAAAYVLRRCGVLRLSAQS